MNPAANHIPGLMSLISAAVAPVVLISAVAIFYSALTSKHSHLSDQVRAVTSEFRHTIDDNARRIALGRQLAVFEHRIDALWLSTGFLSLALLSFITTVFFVIWSQHTQHMGIFGIASLVIGLAFLILSVCLEMYEIALSHRSLRLEVQDVDSIRRQIDQHAPISPWRKRHPLPPPAE